MSPMFEKIQTNLMDAQKSGDVVGVSTLRLLLSACKDRMIELRPLGKELDDGEVLGVIGKQVKQRRESIDEYEKGDRSDLVAKEQAELTILVAYLPTQLTAEEVRQLVDEAIKAIGAKSVAEMGKVMGVLAPKIKGKADGGEVSKMVKELLS